MGFSVSTLSHIEGHVCQDIKGVLST